MDSSVGSELSGVKALEELSAQKVLEMLQKDEHAVQTFDSFDPAMQRLVFPHLWQDYHRLHKLETEFEDYQKNCPTADRHLYFSPGMEEAESSVAGKYSSDIARHFEDKMEFLPVTGLCDFSALNEMICWDGHHIYMGSDSNKGFEVLECKKESHARVCKGRRVAKDPCFSAVISPQLLLYRLIVIFGRIPPLEDRYYTPWALRLGFKDDPGSELRLEDNSGAAHAFFKGSRAASQCAVEFLSYVVSNKVYLTDDEYLTGRAVIRRFKILVKCKV